MTTEQEKTFFDTFGIEPKYKTCVFKYCKNKKEYDCENCNDREWHYPQITDNILLQLLEILLKFLYVGIKKGTDFYEIDIQGWIGTKGKTLQEAVLQMFINITKTDFKEVVVTDIQEIFKE